MRFLLRRKRGTRLIDQPKLALFRSLEFFDVLTKRFRFLLMALQLGFGLGARVVKFTDAPCFSLNARLQFGFSGTMCCFLFAQASFNYSDLLGALFLLFVKRLDVGVDRRFSLSQLLKLNTDALNVLLLKLDRSFGRTYSLCEVRIRAGEMFKFAREAGVFF